MLPQEIESKRRHADVGSEFERMNLVVENFFLKVHGLSVSGAHSTKEGGEPLNGLMRGWKAGVMEAIELTNLLTIFLQPHDKPFDDVVYANVSLSTLRSQWQH